VNGPYVELELSVFGSFSCTKEVTLESIKVELLIFKKIAMPIDPFNPLDWWSNHKQQFSNLSYLVHQVMGIIGSQMNLNNLVLIMKNWPNDARFGFTNGPKSIEEYLR
jgi:hypothetical protein